MPPAKLLGKKFTQLILESMLEKRPYLRKYLTKEESVHYLRTQMRPKGAEILH